MLEGEVIARDRANWYDHLDSLIAVAIFAVILGVPVHGAAPLFAEAAHGDHKVEPRADKAADDQNEPAQPRELARLFVLDAKLSGKLLCRVAAFLLCSKQRSFGFCSHLSQLCLVGLREPFANTNRLHP